MRLGDAIQVVLDDGSIVQGALQEITPSAITVQRESKKDKRSIRVDMELVKVIAEGSVMKQVVCDCEDHPVQPTTSKNHKKSSR